MRSFNFLTAGLSTLLLADPVGAQTNESASGQVARQPMTSLRATNELGLATNGPAILHLFRITQSWTNERPLPPRLATNATYLKTRPFSSSSSWTNAVFSGFLPESLNHA